MIQLIIDMVTVFLLSFIPATFNYFLDYCVGHPMSDQVSTKAIFFRYSFWLANKALPLKKRKEIVAALSPLLNSDDIETRKQGVEQLKLSIMAAGRQYFFYEQAIGMCPFCTNFWVSQITALILYFTTPLLFIHPIFFFLLIPIYSHSILRKL